MKQTNFFVFLFGLLILFSMKGYAQTSLYFDQVKTDYVKSYTFTTGDAIYFSKERKTSTNDVCEMSSGETAPNRVQDSAFIVALKSTTMDSVIIYGKGTSTKNRSVTRVEISSIGPRGPYTDITAQVSITGKMKSSCSTIKVKNIGAQKGQFVKFTSTIVDTEGLGTLAELRISELQVFPIGATSMYFDHAQSTTKTKYRFLTGDSLYFASSKTSTSDLCNLHTGDPAPNRIQLASFTIALKSTSMDTLLIFGQPASTKIRNISKVEIAHDGPYGTFTDITNQVKVGQYMQSQNCNRQLEASNIGAQKGDYVRVSITITDPTDVSYGLDGKVNIVELLATPKLVEVIQIEDDVDNDSILEAYKNKKVDVTIVRDFVADGAYNTICLPINLSQQQIETIFGTNTKLKKLLETNKVDESIELKFADADSIKAGVPYLIRNTQEVKSFTIPETSVTTVAQTAVRDHADFVGVFSPTQMVADDKSNLFLGDDNTLYWPEAPALINGLRGYFILKSPAAGVSVRINMLPSGVEEVHSIIDSSKKMMVNGEIRILRNGIIYNSLGQRVQ